MIQHAAALHWGYAARGCLYVFATMSDNRVLCRYELTWLRVAPEDAVAELKAKLSEWGIALPRDAARLGLPMLRYVVAQDEIFPRPNQSSTGETISETFSRAGFPMRRADMDELNGWNRLRSWFREREHEDKSTVPPTTFTGPSMIVHPDCKFLIRTLPTLQSDPLEPDTIIETVDAYPARAARYFVMSRPSPTRKMPPPPPPRDSVYYDVDKIRRTHQRPILGSENVI